jgi:RimJ/RimL family protein N-acetyltransferase
MRSIQFRPISAADLETLQLWLERPHMREWWGDPETELGVIRDMIEGRDTTQPFVFEVDGEALGYIQVWFVCDQLTESMIADYPWLVSVPDDAVGIDLSIGDPQALSKGIGTDVLRAFVARLRAQGHQVIIIDPDPANHRAVRAYEKAGFRPLPHLLGKTGDTLIMQFHPDGPT